MYIQIESSKHLQFRLCVITVFAVLKFNFGALACHDPHLLSFLQPLFRLPRWVQRLVLHRLLRCAYRTGRARNLCAGPPARITLLILLRSASGAARGGLAPLLTGNLFCFSLTLLVVSVPPVLLLPDPGSAVFSPKSAHEM